ncbi:N-acetylmannosamine-6-phosphate 2-epimerase [Paramicrobacterium agarici]|uniref:N-acylglucosamine-6-phosphate 2-epimerase n=1 Tax=Paramicrobacterium agarici TaxID=630514 RepID=A0A2A9DTM8_9MICO|nr:putative N-acetylmannosamine-6-phosphate 2-epimerase [Microbacterium agarici]PFG29953.1 N-acylglucosamine-6-phosphate 2-epimerase [Microbacterium agarici]
MHERIAQLKHGFIASVQADEGSPLRDSRLIAALAHATVLGGANGLRINSPADIRAVREITDLPVIGLHKQHNGTRDVITPLVEHALELAQAGADIVAVDASREIRGGDLSIIGAVRDLTGLPVMADVSTLDEGLRAWDAGAALVGTTLSGYTPYTRADPEHPDFALVEQLAARGVRVIAEGRLRSPADVVRVLDLGAYAAVVGRALTDPLITSARYAAAVASARSSAAPA